MCHSSLQFSKFRKKDYSIEDASVPSECTVTGTRNIDTEIKGHIWMKECRGWVGNIPRHRRPRRVCSVVASNGPKTDFHSK